LYFAIFIF